eukprot:CAMPEP_0170568372 /NCGR_PEP_ID=MMETSP0211-20121228/81141_1 /TAXON_ID=311385 /ORGANISM="Pseudokeronopsis sp., Strain OXSARD2" /LENGTH=53 /DNA_ID=CAMNT_0010890229 /DNA_START=70 /DNA_END=231 /DNA_ORIENTATION=-
MFTLVNILGSGTDILTIEPNVASAAESWTFELNDVILNSTQLGSSTEQRLRAG